jgi:MFS family permease
MQKSHDHKVPQKVTRSLNHAITDGRWWSVMVGFGESFIGAFGQFLGASAFMQGMLSTIPQFVSSIATLLSHHVTAFLKSRKRMVLVLATLQAITWLGMLFLSYWFNSVVILIIFATLYFVFGAMASPTWSSWMGDLVPEERRGAYFGLRNRKMGLWLLVSTLIASFMLSYLTSWNQFYVFAILFTIAFLARLISVVYLSLMYEPHVELKKFPWLSPKEYFLKSSDNLLHFTGANSFLMFGVFIASPFIIALYFQVFKFTLAQYAIIVVASTLANVVTIQLWGKKSDEFGPSVILKTSTFIICTLPIFWLLAIQFPSMSFGLVIIAEILSGLGWAAYNLASSNFLYDNASNEYRIVLFSYHNVFRGISILIGTLFGAFLISLMSGILILAIIVSFVCRLSAIIGFMGLKEVKYRKTAPPLYSLAGSVVVGSVAVTTLYGLNRTVDFMRSPLEAANKQLKFWQDKFDGKKK